MNSLFSIDFTNYGFVADLGLIFDIFGSFLLLKGILSRNTNVIIRESSTPIGGNPDLTFSNAQQSAESFCGFIFIGFGFIVQYITNMFLTETKPPFSVIPFIIGLAICLLAYLFISKISIWYGRKVVITGFKQRILEDLSHVIESRKGISEDSWATYWGKLLKIKRRLKENDSKYAKRITVFVKQFNI